MISFEKSMKKMLFLVCVFFHFTAQAVFKVSMPFHVSVFNDVAKPFFAEEFKKIFSGTDSEVNEKLNQKLKDLLDYMYVEKKDLFSHNISSLLTKKSQLFNFLLKVDFDQWQEKCQECFRESRVFLEPEDADFFSRLFSGQNEACFYDPIDCLYSFLPCCQKKFQQDFKNKDTFFKLSAFSFSNLKMVKQEEEKCYLNWTNYNGDSKKLEEKKREFGVLGEVTHLLECTFDVESFSFSGKISLMESLKKEEEQIFPFKFDFPKKADPWQFRFFLFFIKKPNFAFEVRSFFRFSSTADKECFFLVGKERISRFSSELFEKACCVRRDEKDFFDVTLLDLQKGFSQVLNKVTADFLLEKQQKILTNNFFNHSLVDKFFEKNKEKIDKLTLFSDVFAEQKKENNRDELIFFSWGRIQLFMNFYFQENKVFRGENFDFTFEEPFSLVCQEEGKPFITVKFSKVSCQDKNRNITKNQLSFNISIPIEPRYVDVKERSLSFKIFLIHKKYIKFVEGFNDKTFSDEEKNDLAEVFSLMRILAENSIDFMGKPYRVNSFKVSKEGLYVRFSEIKI
jgi:hypothetical protein